MKQFCCLTLSFSLLLLSCRPPKETLFELLSPSATGVTFANRLQETEQANILTYEYFYNGGGVAAGDINNDGLVDLFFTGNQVENKLYLNKGALEFEDISAQAGITGRKDAWKTGVSLVDINADGWLDIYVCYSGPYPPKGRKNQLFINTSPSQRERGPGGEVTFTEQAEQYGLADPGYSTQAAFFDYDGDDDLDAFILNHNLRGYQRQEAHAMRTAKDEFAGDKLFRNDGPPSPTGGGFTEVTQLAGIRSNPLGFGLGLAIADVNGDNRPDIYVGNDYVEDDYLYINHGNGTFTDELRHKLGHTSRFTMGTDIADVNNDTQPDIFTLDMLPEDNARQKLLAFPDNWNTYQSTLNNGFWHQNMRNMLHLNNADGSFSEVGQLLGVSNTDWSWAALFADFDNDGWKDLFVSNGELRDLTNSDFIKYAEEEEIKKAAGKGAEAFLEQIKKMPSSETRNYIFKNHQGQRFENKQVAWGFDRPTIANGAVIADLDNDGDLEIITNTNNEVARIYKNNSRELAADNQPLKKNHVTAYLKVKLKGSPGNPFGIGAKIWVTGNALTQYQELSPVRGFQSSMYDALHFGLGSVNSERLTVKVVWQDGKGQVLHNVTPNQTLTVQYAQASPSQPEAEPIAALFQETDSLSGFRHQENYSNDFSRQLLLPYQYSYTGARMAKADINGDGLTDLHVGGARNQPGRVYLQKPENQFIPLLAGREALEADSAYEDKDAIFFDADGDQDLDLYVVSGDYGLTRNHPYQQDRLYFNDGKGQFKRDTTALPAEHLNGSCVKVLDIDQDGDSDLFLGGFVVPGFYPAVEPTRLLLNDGKGKFTRGAEYFLGMVSDAAVADVDKNGFPDIIAVGEWMKPTILLNQKGRLSPDSSFTKPLNHFSGWWNRIAAEDLDGDGDLDFVLGNLGLNCQMKASGTAPITLVAADFDQNGTFDPIMSYYINGVSYPALGRDEALEQLVSLRKKFTNYESFSKATLEDFFTKEQLQLALHQRIDFTETVLLENTGKAFVIHRLPIQAQYSPIHAVAIGDYTGDGQKDILLCGNNSTYRLRIGRMDANNGVLLAGKGRFTYEYVPQIQSGFQLRGDVKDIQQMNDNTLLFFINNGPVKMYKKNQRRKQHIQ